MRVDVPARAVAAGFCNEPAGTHSSRTIMLAELGALLGATPVDASYEDYAVAVVTENALGKATLATRAKSLRHLRELYALRSDMPVFGGLRIMWSSDREAHPLLALLCAVARDPLLRSTAELVLETGTGSVLSAADLAEAVSEAFPRRFTGGVLARIGRNIASSWKQSGHVHGRSKKVRARAHPTPTAAAYALFLAHLLDATGSGLFRTLPVRLLDVPEADARELARAASRLGWISYRASAGMTEVTFRHIEALVRGEAQEARV